MRDVLLTLLLAGLVPAVIMRPSVGAYAWAWISLMNPQRLIWGFAQAIPFAQIIAIATMIGSLSGRRRQPFPVNGVTVIYVCFLAWMSITSLFALNEADIIWLRWTHIMKIHIMMFLTLMLIRGRHQIEALVWVVTLSIGYYGIKGGLFTILTAGAYRVWGPPSSFIEGNNELAVALIMLVPFMIYLYRVSTRRIVRWLLAFGALMCVVSIFGSQSRGAFLGLGAMLLFLGIKSRRPALFTTLLVTLFAVGALLMPENWTSRMETIVNYGQEASAMSRIYVWKTIWALALDRPFVGAGFATDSVAVFSRYAPPGFEQFDGSLWVAHSIYFQALGEHGFPGLLLYIALGLMTWRRAGKLADATTGDPEFGTWVPLLMRCVQVSQIGFAVGGAFLNLVHFDLPYYMVAYVVLVDLAVRQHQREARSRSAGMAAAAPSAEVRA